MLRFAAVVVLVLLLLAVIKTTQVKAAMSLRKFLRDGGKSYGPLLLSDSPVVTEVLSLAGYQHIIIDHEHGPTDVRSGQAMLQAIQNHQSKTEAIVRLPGPDDAVYMKKVLDSLRLPGGVLVPMVNDAAAAERVVQSTRYPMMTTGGGDGTGIRGCAAPFVRGSAYGYEKDYVRQCQEDLLVMVQVETVAGVDAIPEIAAVDGIDGIFVGPLDLSASMGKMGQYQDPEFQAILALAEQTILASDQCWLAGFRAPGRELSDMFDDGYSLVCGSVDLGLLQEAARRDVLEGNKAAER